MPKTQRFVTLCKKQTIWIRALGLLLRNRLKIALFSLNMNTQSKGVLVILFYDKTHSLNGIGVF
ncbi:hypothetical protein HpBGD45_04990 [Helicobacter pylori]